MYFLYWLMQTKRQMLLSGIILLLGITFINKFYKFSQEVLPQKEGDFTLMSYNVRIFNLYDWIPRKDIAEQIHGFVAEKNPDILCLQEYSKKADTFFNGYKYKYVFKQEGKTAQAIYSRFAIIDSGYIEFKGSGNNVVYADIVKEKDTLRVYSMHLQSIKISPDIHEKIDEEKSKIIFKRISEAFKKQQRQAELVERHKNNCPYTMIICGDLNNSAFSYVYRSVRGDMKDAFEEAGNGFGKSYNFKYYPARIDYVFAGDSLEVKEFNTFNTVTNSDHFPIMARLNFKKNESQE